MDLMTLLLAKAQGGGGTGGGVTSWDDLQDRPFYVDVVGEVVTFDGVIEKGIYETPFLGDIPVGETVTVIYDGVEYSCRVSSVFSAEFSLWGKYVGNLNLWGETMPDTGEPFTIVDQYNDSTFNNLQQVFVFGAVFNETTVRISYLEKDIKPIPEELLHVKGNLIVNIYTEGINEEDMTFINPTADKTVDDIITAVRSGVNVIASITVNGMTVFAPFSQLVGRTTMFQMNYCMADVPSIMGVTIEIDGDTNAIIAGFHEIQFSN